MSPVKHHEEMNAQYFMKSQAFASNQHLASPDHNNFKTGSPQWKEDTLKYEEISFETLQREMEEQEPENIEPQPLESMTQIIKKEQELLRTQRIPMINEKSRELVRNYSPLHLRYKQEMMKKDRSITRIKTQVLREWEI